MSDLNNHKVFITFILSHGIGLCLERIFYVYVVLTGRLHYSLIPLIFVAIKCSCLKAKCPANLVKTNKKNLYLYSSFTVKTLVSLIRINEREFRS
jgi:hypothetical protein